MRMAGRFSRRLHAFAKSRGIAAIDYEQGERKHEIAEEYLAPLPTVQGLFLMLVSRAVAWVWKVRRPKRGESRGLAQQKFRGTAAFALRTSEAGSASYQGLAKGEDMLLTPVAQERFHDRLLTGLDAPVTRLNQSPWIEVTRQDRIKVSQTGGPGDVADDAMNLKVHLVQRLLHVLKMS
jgi:hypothetical protein